jgi:hypothetical protein
MSKSPPELAKWTKRLEAMKKCRAVTELVKVCGMPPHKAQHDSMEIWHYPLGIADGTLYSIHVAVLADQVTQAYMHMEPTTTIGQVRKRPWLW